jgi:hypothetical protein
MKKYQLQKQNDDEVLGTFDSKQKAANEMEEIIENNNDDLDEDNDSWLTPFDFTLKEIEVKEEINEIVDSYEAAMHYLGYQADVKTKISNINPKHIKALIALNTLFTIADAWNKADDFVPDFSNRNQYKYFPWFQYNDSAAGFVYVSSINAASYASAFLGFRLCFKSSETAHQFGNQFINLWNDVLLFR